MSDATTGVPAAKASVSTMPKLSPPSDGAHSMSALLEHAALVGVAALAERDDVARSSISGAISSGVDADDVQLHRQVLAQRLEGAQQHRQPLALDGLADEGDPQRLAR